MESVQSPPRTGARSSSGGRPASRCCTSTGRNSDGDRAQLISGGEHYINATQAGDCNALAVIQMGHGNSTNTNQVGVGNVAVVVQY